MENEMISLGEKENFLATSTLFVKEFEKGFVDYFTSLYEGYEKEVSKEESHEIALAVYHGLFKCEADIFEIREKLFTCMYHNGLLIGFLINRSFLYLLEKYLAFAHEHHITPQVELLIGYISRFVTIIESKATSKTTNTMATLDFSFSNDIMFSHINNIVETFEQMRENNVSVVFLNLYKGVPISSEATVIGVEGDNVIFRIEKLQEIAMKLDGKAFIVRNDYFNKHLKADIVSCNFQTNTVVLNNFIYLLNMPALQREFIRVHPDIVAKVFLHQFGNVQTSGRLFDISMNGLGVVSSENNGIFVGAKILVEFELNSASVVSNGDKKIEVHAEVMNVIDYKDSYRYCMRIFPDQEMSSKIFQYIAKREGEILKELNNELNEYVM